MLKFIKNNCYLIYTFLISLLIFFIVFYIKTLSPFGSLNMLKIDFFHQYGPMLFEFYNRIISKKSLIYSFNMSMGLPFYRNFFNYLSSPFNLLIFLFRENSLTTSFSIIVAFKSILSSLTFYYLLKCKHNKDNYLFIILSLLYATNAYFVSYFFNIMWLDGMLFLPLIVLGIESLISSNKYFLYIISLSLAIISNYYIGFILCIFSFIYFIIYLIQFINSFDFKLIMKITLRFIISSLIVILLTLFVTLPIFTSLNTISASKNSFTNDNIYNFSLIEFINGHYSFTTMTVFNDDMFNNPNISCGILSVFLLILFIINPKIKLKVKITYIILIGFYILCFFNSKLDYFMHAMHLPNDLPYRYSFIYSFLLLLVSSYSFNNIKNIKSRYILISYFLVTLLILISYIYNNNQISDVIFVFNILFLSIYFILCLVYHFNYNIISSIIFICFVFFEIIINLVYNMDFSTLNRSIYDNYFNIKNDLNNISSIDKSFYRVESDNTLTLNDSSLYGYNSITSFSSMTYESLAYLQYKLGLKSNQINCFEYKNNTPIYDILFNIKYFISNNFNNNFEQLIYDNDNYQIYKSKYESNLFYKTNSDIKNFDYFDNPIDNQNNLYYMISGYNVFDKINLKEEETKYFSNYYLIKYSIDDINELFYYASDSVKFFIIDDILYDCESDSLNEIKYKNDLEFLGYYDYSEKYIVKFSNVNYIYIAYYYDDYDVPNVYYINDKFNLSYDSLVNNIIGIDSFSETSFSFSTNYNEDIQVFSSIPYDKDWYIYIDNKKVSKYKFADSLLAFDIKKGKHNIKIKYIPFTLYLSLFVSLITILLLFVFNKKMSKLN